MCSEINNLAALTRAMAEALERDDLELCSMLVAERGRALAKLLDGRDEADRLEPSLREALVEIRRQDEELSARLAGGMAAAGAELSRLGGRRSPLPTKRKARRFDGRA